MSNYGDLDFEPDWQDSPVQKYMDYKKTREDHTDSWIRTIEHAVAISPPKSDYESWDEYVDWQSGMTIEDAWNFLDQLRASDLTERTVEHNMRIVQSFLDDLRKRNVVDANPVSYVCDEAEFAVEEKGKIERTVGELGDYLGSLSDPQYRAMGILFAKTGVRVGEMMNIDLMDLNLNHQSYQSFIAERDIDIHPVIEDRPDSLYISSEPMTGREYRGEERWAGNKRKRDTVIPIDKETKLALLDWIAMRPQTEYPHPLYVGERHPRRLSNVANDFLPDKYAEEAGFVDDGSDVRFSPHWFRHFFTTQLHAGYGDHEGHLEPTIIKYLRGDVYSTGAPNARGDDIMEVYLHDWGDTVRPEYERAIYQFGIYG